MTKKVFVLFTISLLTTNVFAVPSVKKLGVNASDAVAKPVTITTPKKSDNNTMVVKSAKTPVSTTNSARTAVGGRLPGIGTAKNIKAVNTNVITKPISQDLKPSVTTDEFNTAVERIDALENQTANAITDVVENETGNYVTDVSVDGNKLNVTKTRLLRAPIRNANGDDLPGDAEIWFVK